MVRVRNGRGFIDHESVAAYVEDFEVPETMKRLVSDVIRRYNAHQNINATGVAFLDTLGLMSEPE